MAPMAPLVRLLPGTVTLQSPGSAFLLLFGRGVFLGPDLQGSSSPCWSYSYNSGACTREDHTLSPQPLLLLTFIPSSRPSPLVSLV